MMGRQSGQMSMVILDMRPSPILCKPPAWCKIEASHRRFYIWPERIVIKYNKGPVDKISFGLVSMV